MGTTLNKKIITIISLHPNFFKKEHSDVHIRKKNNSPNFTIHVTAIFNHDYIRDKVIKQVQKNVKATKLYVVPS